jgi:hypothetical protein
MSQKQRRIYTVIASIFALFLVASSFYFSHNLSEAAQNFKTQWVNETGKGFVAPACGSSSAGPTCSAGSPIVTFTWNDTSGVGAGGARCNSVWIRANATADPDTAFVVATGLPCSGSYTWNQTNPRPPLANTNYIYFIRFKTAIDDLGNITTFNGLNILGHLIDSGVAPTPNCALPPPNPDPIGWHDGSDCTQSVGWTCDASDYNAALEVHFYEGTTFTTFLGSAIANQPREPGVAAACGGNPNHGFTWPTPASLKDGVPHSITAYAINTPGPANNPPLSGTPKSITCAVPSIVLSCSVSPSAILTGKSALWTANVSGGTAPYTFTWTSNNAEGPSGTGNTKNVTYNQEGVKTASVTVVDSVLQSFGPVACGNTLTVRLPECGDGIDNIDPEDESPQDPLDRRLIDCQDPACHTDGNPNNPDSCDPTIDDETDSTFREIFLPFRKALAMLFEPW